MQPPSRKPRPPPRPPSIRKPTSTPAPTIGAPWSAPWSSGGCGHGVCGACTVLVDGAAVRACLMLAVQADGVEVVTVEGLSYDDRLTPLQASFRKHHALQCGFCTPGMITPAHALLTQEPDCDAARVREVLSGNLCRCTGYISIVEAVLEARAAYRRGGKSA